jgi:integrase
MPIGDSRKRWATACKAIGLEGRIVHDLRRSGVKHLIDAGIDPHTAMAFSGHRTASMLRRYHIIDVDDLRRAAERAQAYSRPGTTAGWNGHPTATPSRSDARSGVP